MKHTRKPLSLLLALMMIVSIFSGLTVTASADTLPTLTIESGEKTVDENGQITVSVSVADNPGFTEGFFTLSYDAEALTLVSAAKVAPELAVSCNTTSKVLHFYPVENANYTGNGTLLTLTFAALKNGETAISMGYLQNDPGNLTNVAEEDVIVSFVPGTVTVAGLPGEEPEEPDYTLRVLTFEDTAGSSYWSDLIDDPQYGGELLYGPSGFGMDEPYTWHDAGNTELYHAMPSAGEDSYGAEYCYWSYGHAISHYVTGDIEDYNTFESQLTVFKEGVEGLAIAGGGHNGSDNFAVHYGYADTSGFGLGESHLPRLSFRDGTARVIDHMYVNLTPYLLSCIVDGNSLTAAMGPDDTLYLRAIGYDADGSKLNETRMTVAQGTTLYVQDWTKWDLSSLGAVSSVAFEINGSSDNGYGFSQPAYFAYDDVAVRFPVQAEPVHTHTTVRHEASAATCAADGNSAYYSCECGKFFSDAEGTVEIEEDSWILTKTGEHVDVKNNETQANGKDGLCDVCGTYCNHAPVLKEGVTNTTANVVAGEAYLLRDLQAGRIFEDPDGDKLSVAGGGAGNAASSTCFYYNRSADNGATWSEELDFASALFGATTISLTEREAGTYLYRFYAKDGFGGDSRDAGDYWYLTLNVDAAANLNFDVRFYIGKDQNYASNGNKMPIIKLWASDGDSNKVGEEIALTAAEAENGYARMNVSVPGGWYVYEGYGWNTATEAYDIPLGGMQIKIPADANVDGNAGGGTDIYLRVMSIYTSSKKADGTYFGAADYTVRVTCPIMQCDAAMGAPYVNGNYAYYPTLFYAGGNSCLFNTYLYPTDTENYNFSQSINGTLPTGTSVQTKSATINGVVQLTVTVPETADFGLYFQYNNFNTSEQAPNGDWISNGDGTKTAVYKVSKSNSNYTWRMTDTTGTYVTKAGWLAKQTADGTKTLSFDGASTEKYSHDFSKLGTTTITRDEADLQVFVDATGAKALGGATERIRAYRMWQLIDSDTANIMTEPDYVWTKLSGPADISFAEDACGELTGTQIDGGNSFHNWADITANGGTSIFAVRYDAIDLDTSNNTTHAGFYPATNPDRVAFVVVADELGSAKANVQFNGDFTANSRLPGWDYIYDTWYYLNGEENPALTFTTTDAVTVEYAFGTTNGSTMASTVSAFTAITAEDGTYSVPLAAMNNAANNFGGTVIIRMTDAAGKASYQLVKVSRMTVTVENNSYPGEPVMPGNTVKLSFDGLYRSINKISGIFNPTTFYLRYAMGGTEVNGTLGQYQQMDNSSITLQIPSDVVFAEGEDTTTVTATNGYVFGSMYSAANPFGAMYYMTDVGVGTNFNAVTVSFAFQKLSDIPITVTKMPTVAVTLNVVGSDSAAVTLTDADGAAQTAENGVYTLGFGTFRYSIEADGFIKEVGKFSVGSADGEAKTVTVTLRAADENTWDGTTTTAVTPNADGIYEIRTGAELAWFAAQVNAGAGVAYNAKLMNDISLNREPWTPIGNSTKKYAGTFDGNGHVITDLYVNSTEANQGLFGYINAATVKNLGVTGEVTSTGNNVGGIVGNGTGAIIIENCFNAADVTGKQGVGGIAGATAPTGKINNCYNVGSITATSKFGGGINGCGTTVANCAVATNCYDIGTVNSAGSGGGINPGAATKAVNSYYLGTSYVTGTSAKAGTAMTETEMKAAAFVTTLGDAFAADSENINNGYPILTWQASAPAHEHSFGAWTSADENNHVRTCDCGETETEAHTWNDGEVTTEPTCTAEGVKTYTCTVCSGTKTEVIPAAGHTAGGNYTFSDADTTDGIFEWAIACTVCGEAAETGSRKYGDVVGASGSDPADGEVDATDAQQIGRHANGKVTLTGIDLYAADTNGDGIVDRVDAIVAAAIALGIVQAAPVPTTVVAESNDDGTHALKVMSGTKRLGYLDDEVECTFGEGEVTTEPTCTAEGVKTYTCTVCNGTKTESVAKTAHTAGETYTFVDADTTDGSFEWTKACAVCGETAESGSRKYGDTNGDGKLTTGDSNLVFTYCLGTGEMDALQLHAADANGDGVITKADAVVITNAAMRIITDALPVATTEAFVSNGDGTHTNHVYYGEKDLGSTADTADCTYDEGVVTTEPTCTAEGVKTYTCTVCNGTKTEVIPAAGHTDANFDAACDVCGEGLGRIHTVEVDFTAQALGAFLCAPAEGAEVASNLAERYGYADGISYLDGVSALDVLVAANIAVVGEEDFAAAPQEFLTAGASAYGFSVTKLFGVSTENNGFAINHGCANDGTPSTYGGYNGYTANMAPISDGDLVEFFLYQDSYASDNYTYVTVAEEAVAGTAFNVNVKGISFGWRGYEFATPEAMKAAAAPIRGISLAIVDKATGALTDLEVETDEEGNVSVTIAQPGTVVLVAYGEDDTETPVIMTMTEITVAEPTGIPGDVDGDGVMDLTDVTLINRSLLPENSKLYKPLTAEQLRLADVNGDGVVDLTDVTLINRALLPENNKLYKSLG